MDNENLAGEPVVQQIREILSSDRETDTQPEETDSQEGGEDLAKEALRGDNSGAGQLDIPATDAVESMEDANQEAEVGDTGGEDQPVTLADLAEHIGGTAADLYELAVPMADGSTVSLGDLKDNYRESGPVKEAREALKAKTDEFERLQLQTRSEINWLMSMIPEQARAGMIQQARERQANWQEEQNGIVLDAMPEWADPEVRAADRAQIVEDGRVYGFSEQEITFTQDARQLRWMRDFSRMKRELQEMNAAAKGQKAAPGKTPKGRRSQNQANRLRNLISKGKATPHMTGKREVVTQLLNME